MKIKTKGIYHERLGDAPFVGALICANNCNIGCENCFNQEIKQLPTIEKGSQEIIEEVLSNPFNRGIILGGLEWTLQPIEAKELISLAKKNNLETILYTGLDEEIFKKNFEDIYNIKGLYIKFGRYDESLKCNKIEYGVQLASSNQKIIKTKE